MKNFIKKIISKIKTFSPTVILFLITFTLTLPINLGLFIAVAMSTDSGMNSLSIYILRDLAALVTALFLPFITLIIFGHFIPIIIMLLLRKKVKFSIKLYLLLLLIQSLPFSFMMFGLHANTSLSYREERINEIKIEKGEIVEGTDMYNLLARYLELDNIKDVENMARQDKLILSYDYIYIRDYLDYIDFVSDDEFLEMATSIYNKEFPDISYIRMNKYMNLYLDMVNEFIDKNMSIKDVHNKIKMFMNKKINHYASDNRNIDDDLEYSVPLIVTYENINILNRAQKEYDNSEHEDIIFKGNLGYSQSRVELFVKGKAYNYQYGENETIKDNKIYVDYCQMIDDLRNEDLLTKEKVIDTIKAFSEKHNLNLENDILNKLQIAFNY